MPTYDVYDITSGSTSNFHVRMVKEVSSLMNAMVAISAMCCGA